MEDKQPRRWKEVHKQSKKSVDRNPSKPSDHNRFRSCSNEFKLNKTQNTTQNESNRSRIKALEHYHNTSSTKLSEYQSQSSQLYLHRFPSRRPVLVENQYFHTQPTKTIEQLKSELTLARKNAKEGKQIQICALAERICEKYQQQIKNLRIAKNEADYNLSKLRKTLEESNSNTTSTALTKRDMNIHQKIREVTDLQIKENNTHKKRAIKQENTFQTPCKPAKK